MNKIKIYLLFTGLLIGTAGDSLGYKIHPNAGETAAPFLKIAPGGRGVAMGEANTAEDSDVFGMWWNPCSIINVEKNSVGATYNRWFQSINSSFIGAVLPQYKQSLGFMLDSMIIGKDMERRTGEDEDDPYFPITSDEGKFGAYDVVIAGVYARKITKDISAGVGLKGIIQNIDDNNAYGIGIDLGMLYSNMFSIYDRKINFGASIRNFGPGIKFDRESFSLPLDFRAGINGRINPDLIMALDLHQAMDNYLKINWGAEYKLLNKLSLRAGYIYRLTGNPLGGVSGIRAGFGVDLGKFFIDYSFTPYSYLGNSHRISVYTVFGKKPKPKTKPIYRKKESETQSKNKDLDDTKIKLYVRPLTITPGKIIWSVECTKSDQGVLKYIQFITQQQDAENADINIIESNKCPFNIDLSDDQKIIKYIEVKHNLNKEYIMDQKVKIEIPSGLKNYKVTDINLKPIELTSTKQKDIYLIERGKKIIDKIILISSE